MSKTLKTRLIQYGVCLAITGIFMGIFIGSSGFGTLTLQQKYLVLADSLTIPGLMMVFSGGLSWLARDGVFDGIVYIGRYVVSMLIPGKAYWRQKYGDFIAQRRDKRSTMSVSFLFISGGVCLGLALLFIWLFYRAYPV